MHPSSGAPSSRRPEFPFVAESPVMDQWLKNAAETAKHGFAVALVAKASSLELPALCKEIGKRVTSRGRTNGITPNEFRFVRDAATMGSLHYLSENEGARAVVFQEGEKISPEVQEDHVRLMQQFCLVVCVVSSDPMLLVQRNAWSLEFARRGTRMVTLPTWNKRPEEDRHKILDLLTARMPLGTTLEAKARSMLLKQPHDGIDDIKQRLTEAFGRMKRSQSEDMPRIITAEHMLGSDPAPRRTSERRPSTNPPAA